jgi:HEAT repeat protein
MSALKNGDHLARVTAARAIGDLGGAAGPAVPALVHALRDASGPLRVQAAHALRRIGPAHAAGAVLQLLEVMQDQREFVSEAAAEAWASLTAPQDPPGLLSEDTGNRYRR